MFRTAAALVLSVLFMAPVAAAAEADSNEAIATMGVVMITEMPITNAIAALNQTAPTGFPLAQPRTSFPSNRRPALLTTMYASLIGLQAFDVYSTMKGIDRGATEANPLMKGVVGNPTAFVAVKAGVTGASIYTAERLWKRNKRVEAVLLMVASNGLMAYVAQHNAGVVSR